jgi:phosphoenolpyruvate carboxykinase (GTP)
LEGRGPAEETPIGFVPTRAALTLDGLKIPPETLRELFRVDADDWELDLADTREFFARFGGRLPSALRDEYQGVIRRFEKSIPAP